MNKKPNELNPLEKLYTTDEDKFKAHLKKCSTRKKRRKSCGCTGPAKGVFDVLDTMEDNELSDMFNRLDATSVL